MLIPPRALTSWGESVEGFPSLDMVELERRREEGKASKRRRHDHAREARCENRLGDGWHGHAWRHVEAVLQFWH